MISQHASAVLFWFTTFDREQVCVTYAYHLLGKIRWQIHKLALREEACHQLSPRLSASILWFSVYKKVENGNLNRFSAMFAFAWTLQMRFSCNMQNAQQNLQKWQTSDYPRLCSVYESLLIRQVRSSYGTTTNALFKLRWGTVLCFLLVTYVGRGLWLWHSLDF